MLIFRRIIILAINEICTRLDYAHYFPAFEILLDDLRDYRFFDRDMVHPNTLAIQYIWERFQQVYLTSFTLEILKRSHTLNGLI